ncbi:MAG TPA: ABC transporter permease subunit, partial [Deinococcales bacterium]|nr:ABC transporter permease subunit [Deinococcales bacterium]
MNIRVVRAIALKDLRAISANLQVLLPMVIVPAVIGVLVPAGLLLTALYLEPGAQLKDLESIIGSLPAGALAEQLALLPGVREQVGYFMANYLLAPFYLLIPLMAASTVTADSFAGEKERGTLESLLFSPATLTELFLGKAAAALAAALALTFGTFLLTFAA